MISTTLKGPFLCPDSKEVTPDIYFRSESTSLFKISLKNWAVPCSTSPVGIWIAAAALLQQRLLNDSCLSLCFMSLGDSLTQLPIVGKSKRAAQEIGGTPEYVPCLSGHLFIIQLSPCTILKHSLCLKTVLRRKKQVLGGYWARIAFEGWKKAAFLQCKCSVPDDIAQGTEFMASLIQVLLRIPHPRLLPNPAACSPSPSPAQAGQRDGSSKGRDMAKQMHGWLQTNRRWLAAYSLHNELEEHNQRGFAGAAI